MAELCSHKRANLYEVSQLILSKIVCAKSKKIIKISFFGHKKKANKDINTKFGTHKNRIYYFDVNNSQFNSLQGLGTGQK